MNQGKLVFAQVMQHLPLTTFRRCVDRYCRRVLPKSASRFPAGVAGAGGIAFFLVWVDEEER